MSGVRGPGIEFSPNFRLPKNFDQGRAFETQRLLRRPAGGYLFTYKSTWLFDASAGGDGIIMQVPTGAHLFRIQRDPHLVLSFLHAAPTTGARIASIDLHEVPESPEVSIAIQWNPLETSLFVAPVAPQGVKPEVKGATGGTSPLRISVHESGLIQELGPGVMGARMFSGGRPVFEPNARDSWADAREAIRVLLTGSSPDTMYPMIIGNQVISMLNTGFETWAKTRFIELEREGWMGDFDAVAKDFISAAWHDKEVARLLEVSRTSSRTPLWELVETRRVDFGDYEQARRAYKAAFGLRFGIELGLPNTDLDRLKRYITFRHRIVHVSPILGFLNAAEFAGGEEPVIAGLDEAQRAMELFDRFIAALDAATRRIRLPPDSDSVAATG